MAVSVEKNYRSPFGVTAEDENNDTVRVCVVLPGLTKKFGKNRAKNGSVEVDFNHRSMDVRVELTTKQKTENYRYTVKRFPDEVLVEKCRYVIEKDKLVIFLAKVKPRSWAAELDQTGLETDRPKEADDE